MRKSVEDDKKYQLSYYYAHKEEISEKNRLRYQEKKKFKAEGSNDFNKVVADMLNSDFEFEDIEAKIVSFYAPNTPILDMIKDLDKKNKEYLFYKAACDCKAAEWEPLLKKSVMEGIK